MMSTFIERKVTKISSSNSNIMHKKVYSDNLLWYYSLFLCYRKTILRIMKTILLIVGLETGYAERSQEGQEKCVYMNQCQDKTNPSLVTGLKCKLYTRNPFDYSRLCELVLG